MRVKREIEDIVIQRTLRVPVPAGPSGSGATAARRLDAALMTVRWKLSGELLSRLSDLDEKVVTDTAARVLDVVRSSIGDHVRHNTYFRDFPRNVPDTMSFWVDCLRQALLDPASAARGEADARRGVLNLLSLPTYGRYLHTYEEMLAAHDELIERAGERVTVLHLGESLEREAERLYLSLATSVIPGNEQDLEALALLARFCADMRQPEEIPVRENRAIINRARMETGADLLVDTVTDVLRLACALSDGDAMLEEPTRFASFPRRVRRTLLAALDEVVRAAPAKLGDVLVHRERWKRLGERLHPHEYPQWPHAAEVFAVARGERKAPSFARRIEEMLAAGDVAGTARMLEGAAGLLYRSADRLLRTAAAGDARTSVVGSLERAAQKVSGRVLLSLREHLHNRPVRTASDLRVFTNRLGRGKVVPDARPPIDEKTLARVSNLLDDELLRRLPPVRNLVVDPDMLDVALPLSGKAAQDGFGVLPRGSVSDVEGELLRFFIYWKERERRTDYDLSALLLDRDFANPTWLSYTSLTQVGGQHSGDITEASEGASEFINLELGKVQAQVIIPQVNIYWGEGFDHVAESFFGFMTRDADQKGRPFEPRTVRMKSDLRGPGRIALPLAFLRGEDGRWRAKWLHLNLKGGVCFNQVEGNLATTSILVRAIVERRYLNVRYLTDLWSEKCETVTSWDGENLPEGPVTFIGMERPEHLPEDARLITPQNLRDLIPD